jgi:hypothetical protein
LARSRNAFGLTFLQEYREAQSQGEPFSPVACLSKLVCSAFDCHAIGLLISQPSKENLLKEKTMQKNALWKPKDLK